jgi:F0F1-type ATP synthase assembly protein I
MTDPLALQAERITAGPLGLLVVLLMGLATVLLIRNMNARLKRLPEQFPPPEAKDDPKVRDEPKVRDQPTD